MTKLSESLVSKVRGAVRQDRLLETATALIEVPSPTCNAGAVADRLAEILASEGFAVERPIADWPEAPAVTVRFEGAEAGRTLQFNGHLDTVHLPFVPPRVKDGTLYGSGASDMKGGVAAFVEALRAVRDAEALSAGSILLTAHDHHEGPWGDKRQLRALIDEGYVGDAVLLPEYLAEPLPLAGRGMAIFEITARRAGEPVHEVLRPPEQPNVVAAGAEIVMQLRELHERVKSNNHSHAGHDSVFVGKIQAGEIYNQSPVECQLSGTRRWIAPGTIDQVEAEFRQLLEQIAASNHVEIRVDFHVQGDAFRIDASDPIVSSFQDAFGAVTGRSLRVGGKPFLDDGNLFAALAGIPALTHGPDAKGAHTTEEWVPVDELVRVAQIYALTAVRYCSAPE